MERPSTPSISATSTSGRRAALGQLLVLLPGVDPDGLPDAATRHAVRSGVGVLHGLQQMPPSAAARYHQAIQQEAARAGMPPVLIAANLECGVSYTLGSGCTDVPYPMGVGWSGSVDVAADAAAIVARQARTIGFHWTFSPCVDVLRSDDDPVIGVRAFGSDPHDVSALGAAFVRATQAANVLATAKHYPGHGNSATDSHLALPVLSRTRQEHDTVHLPPFRAAVEAGVASIMTAHVTIPALGLDVPASLSLRVTNDWLRRDLGFTGIIITDALGMRALSSSMSMEEACHASLVAGADVLDAKIEASGFDGLVDRLERTLDSGDVSAAQVDGSVARLAAARVRFGVAREAIDLEAARALDQATLWAHPSRSSTARRSAGGSLLLAGVREIVVATDTEEARLVASLLQARTGLGVTIIGLADIEPGETRPERLVLGVVRPPLPLTAGALAGFSRLCMDGGLDGLLATRPIPAMPATRIPVVSAPVVDLFEHPSSAAVSAALDLLL